METVYQITALFSFAILTFTLISLGYLKTVRPSSLFFFFFALQYGPLFLVDARYPRIDEFTASFYIADFGTTIAQYTYAALSISYLGLSTGLIGAELALFKIESRASVNIPTMPRTKREEAYLRQMYQALLALAALSTIALLSLGIIQEKLAFFYSIASGHVDAAAYAAFRKITLSNDPNAASIVRLRMNFLIPLMALITSVGIYIRRPLPEVSLIAAAFSVVTIFDLGKQGIVVTFLVFFACIYLVKTDSKPPIIRNLLIPGILVAALGIFLLFALYAIQYRGSADTDVSALWLVLYYRITRINADVLNLYFVFFQHPLFEQGVTNSTILASLFDKKMLDVTSYIPQVYGQITSFPTVFFAGMWSDFGWAGIALSSFAVGVICAVNDYVARALKSVPIRAAFMACAAFTLNQFGQVQFLTCLLTYGVVFVVLGFCALDYFFWRQFDGTTDTGTERQLGVL